MGDFRNSDLVELIIPDLSFKLEIRYAKTNNFPGKAVYGEERAFLQRPAAEALKIVNQEFHVIQHFIDFSGVREKQKSLLICIYSK